MIFSLKPALSKGPYNGLSLSLEKTHMVLRRYISMEMLSFGRQSSSKIGTQTSDNSH